MTAAIATAAAQGTTFGAPTPGEVLLAEAICDRVPGCEQVRLVSSGTEAAMSAVRLARGATGRDRVVKFDGCYHGHSDGLLAGGGSGVATLGLPGSAGVPAGAVADTVVGALQRGARARRHGGLRDRRAGGGQHEPGPARRRVPGGLRAACDAAGALLIFDEVITGFRLGPGGATAWSGVTPDLWCFGKVIGGGLPVGAFGGPARPDGLAGPGGPGVPGGHAVGEPVGHGGGTGRARSTWDRTTTTRSAPGWPTFAKELESALRRGWPGRAGADGRAPGRPLRGPPGGRPARAPRTTPARRRWPGNGTYPRFFHAMLRRGVALAPGAYEVMFPGLAHDDAVLDRVVEVAGDGRDRGGAGAQPGRLRGGGVVGGSTRCAEPRPFLADSTLCRDGRAVATVEAG